jgi:peroxiredoxin
MKKSIMLLALAAVAFVSCKNLADNEYEITGEIDNKFDGKKAILQKPGGMFGQVPVDTVVIKDGEFVFHDTLKLKNPELYSITIDGINGGLVFVMEPGAIDITVHKDTISKSKTGGTYNNEKLEEFKQINFLHDKTLEKFTKANQEKMQAAQTKKDTAAANKIMKDYKKIFEDTNNKYIAFIKENPKALFSLYALQKVASSNITDKEEAKKMFVALDASIKNTEFGKQAAVYFGLAKPEMPKEMPQQPKAGVKVGQLAPPFSAPTPDGKTLALKDAMGKVTIIDFWASWCGPCRKENPNVVALYNEYHAKGLNIIGVSLDKEGESAKWKEAIAKDKLTWNHVSNLKYWKDPIAQQYGVDAIPATFILDASGKIVATNLRGDELKAKVQELLK